MSSAPATRRHRATGRLLTVGSAADLGLDDVDGRWVTICEAHSTCINSTSRAAALAAGPLDFCDLCRRLEGQSFGDYLDGILDAELARSDADLAAAILKSAAWPLR